MEFLVLLVLIAPVAVFVAVMRNRGLRREVNAATVDLRIDEFGAHRELEDGRVEEIDWDEVVTVSVLLTVKGPHRRSGGVIVLWGNDVRGCLVPVDRAGESGLLETLPRLPGFDSRLLVEALGTKPPSETVVWRRDS